MNILLIDGGQAFSFTGGRLNHTLHQTARETLSALGHAIKETVIEDGYDKEAEVEKWLTTRLPSFICNDVIKNPQVEKYIADYRAHLQQVFAPTA